MKIRVLGTSSAFPTKNRNHSANLIKYSGEILLFDCGEGTQRQKSGRCAYGFKKINKRYYGKGNADKKFFKQIKKNKLWKISRQKYFSDIKI